jgi:hypothetical protein
VPTAPDVTEAALLDDFRRLARENAFEAFEMPRAVGVLRGDGSEDGDFTVDNGCLTGTGKLARIGVQKRFGAAFAALYERTRAVELAIEARGGARSLADILSLLGHTDISVAERFSFRQLGGDSIAAVRCAKTLRIDATALLSDVPLAKVLQTTGDAPRNGDVASVDEIVRVWRPTDDERRRRRSTVRFDFRYWSVWISWQVYCAGGVVGWSAKSDGDGSCERRRIGARSLGDQVEAIDCGCGRLVVGSLRLVGRGVCRASSFD